MDLNDEAVEIIVRRANPMDLKEILQTISAGDVALVAFLFLSLIQITPIKINPWSALARWFGKTMNGEILKKQEEQQKSIDRLERGMDSMRKCNERRRADEARNRILRFDDELRRKIPHSLEFWQQTLDDCDWYVGYCKDNEKYVNSKCGSAIKNIRTTYDHVKVENDFI